MDVNAVCLPVVLYCVLSRAVQWNTVQGVVLHCCRAVACSAQLCFALLSRVVVFPGAAGAGGGSAQRVVLKNSSHKTSSFRLAVFRRFVSLRVFLYAKGCRCR